MYGLGVLCLCSISVVRLCSIRFSSSKNTKKLLEFLADMPKANSARIAEAQRQRQNISKKSDKYAPSTVYLQVIGSGARGSPNTVYLFTDQKRYLFNCGECTQRLAHEHKVKLSRLEHIFITSKTWKNIGGLPGLSLTLQDVGVPNITLHGPEGLDELYNATKRFVVMKDMTVKMEKCCISSQDFEDNALTVKYVLLGPHESLISYEKPTAKRAKLENIDKEFEEFSHDDTDYYKSPACDSDSSSIAGKKEKYKLKFKEKEVDKAEKQLLKTEKVLQNLEKRSACTVAFICTLKKRMGTLDLAKCVEKGVKPGPLLGQLKNGQDVVLPDGTLVMSKDVKTPDDPGPVFIVMEVPDLSYLKETEFAAHFDNPSNPSENIPALIVHLTPPHVFNHATYRTFMAMFGPTTRHLVLNSQNSCLGSEAVHRTQHKLNLLDSEIFPLLKDPSMPAVWTSSPTQNNDSPTRRGLEDLKNKIAVAQFQNIINMEGSKGDGQTSKDEEREKLEVVTARTLTMFHLRPKKQVDRSAEPKLHIQDYIQETMDVDGFVGSLEQFKRMVENMRYARMDSQREYPKVVFLGTGSCIPSKTRNTSAIVLQMNDGQSMLLDCGEGTFGQLVRFYGPKKVNSFLRTLTAVYISHLHADHHIGLIGVVQARRDAFREAELPYEPLYLFAPGQIITWLSVYDNQFERIKDDFTLIPNQNLLVFEPPKSPSKEQTVPKDLTTPNYDISPAVLASIGIQNIRTCLVNHCPNAFGVTLELDGVHKLTYSGDTIPSEALVQLGKDSTLLIHEATMEDELAEEARIKMHSTTSQAIEIGRQMGARYTLLTHFSQRYARLPRLNAHILNDNKTVGIAFDNMQISMNDLELLPHMYAPLQLMFAEHCVEMEMKAMNRARQKQRRSSSPGMPNYECRNRLTSPGCRLIPSAPVPHANYRETNASRLRQEIKGMTITGFVRGSRSSSSSPCKTKSGGSSPSRSLSRDPTRNVSDRTIDLMSSRTMSETSNSSRDTQDKYKTSLSGNASDTPMKTPRTATNSTEQILNMVKAEALKDKNRDLRPTKHISRSINSKGNGKGYGKPLVTPMNKKLSIRREYSAPHDASTGKESNHVKIKQPITARPPSPLISRQLSKVPLKANQVRGVHKHPFSTSSKLPDGCNGKQHQLPNKNAPTMSTPCSDVSSILKKGLTDVRSGGNAKYQRPMSASSYGYDNGKEQNDYKPRDIKSAIPRNKVRLMQPEPSSGTPSSSNLSKMTPVRSSLTRIPHNINSENSLKQRRFSTEKLKQQFCRDMPVYAAGRPNSTALHSNTRAFKPQLEDIKSSYLLLNKSELEHEKKMKAKTSTLADRVEDIGDIHKLRVLSDNDRREHLNKIKQKFKSRQFFQDSRYEKIEGLNWITWKD